MGSELTGWHAFEAQLPAVNAGLNALSAVLLIGAYLAIHRRQVVLHKWLMISAFTISVVFLASYLYFHIVVRGGEPTRFTTPGWPRILYLTILLSHTVLAALVAPLALISLILGFGAPGNRHARLARWVLPTWLYVSVTGVVVYLLLYQIYPPA